MVSTYDYHGYPGLACCERVHVCGHGGPLAALAGGHEVLSECDEEQ
jgi:hypothetical protein